MSDHHSTAPSKPNKPQPDFPLFAHAAGCWAKKIDAKKHYFGKWSDADGALKECQDFAEGKPAIQPRCFRREGGRLLDCIAPPTHTQLLPGRWPPPVFRAKPGARSLQ